LEQYGRRQNLEIQGVAMNDDQETPQELELKVLSVLQYVDGSIDKDDIDVMHRLVQFSSVYLCIPTKHRILHQEYRDRKRRP